MATHLHSLLSQWYPARDQWRWVLGTVINIEGSNYRKTGAMILVNELGQYYGLISGGCLEKSLLADVKKVLIYDQPLQVCYDSSEQSDTPWAKALGCGGKVTLWLQPVHAQNQYHQLEALYNTLQQGRKVWYGVCLTCDPLAASTENQLFTSANKAHCANLANRDQSPRPMMIFPVRGQTQLVVFGAGVDALPLVQMANILGWRVTVVDGRLSPVAAAEWGGATIIRANADSDELASIYAQADAAIVMTHNLAMDAAALRQLQHVNPIYIGLLGPIHRKQKVLALAELENHTMPIYGPMGLHIGGDLPESVALSTLAQCHQIVEAAWAKESALKENSLIESTREESKSPENLQQEYLRQESLPHKNNRPENSRQQNQNPVLTYTSDPA